MSKGFFSNSQMQSEQKLPQLSRCGRCGLYKHCQSPKMPPTGKGKKKILVVAEAPGKKEDERNTQLVGKAGKFFRRQLDFININLDRDCWKTNAIICRREGNKTPEGYMIEACRPNLIKTIEKLQPNVIFLLGGVAYDSLLSEVWKGNIGSVSRWAGFCIPCTKPNAWIVPTYHPSYIMRVDDKVLTKIFRKHLKQGIKKAKSKPWTKIPNYKGKIEIILSPSKAAKVIRVMTKKGGPIAFDYETNCLKPEQEGSKIVSCSVCWRGKKTIAYPWKGEAVSATSELLESPIPKIGASLQFEDRWTRVKLSHPVKNWCWDTVVAAHVLDNRPHVTSVKFQVFVLLGAPNYKEPLLTGKVKHIHELDMEDLLLYNGLDSYFEYQLAIKQKKLMKKREKQYD